MPDDDSAPIPIYFLSLMLLKSPTRSANRERAQNSGGEGRRGLGLEGATAEVVTGSCLGALRPGFKSYPEEPRGKPGLYLSVGNNPLFCLLCPPQGTVSKIY